MRHYETIIIIRPNAGEADLNAKIAKVTGVVNNFHGTMVRVDNWGLKRLAYLINKEQQGVYVYFEYAAPPETVAELERQLRIDDTILKYITVKLHDVYQPAAQPEAAVAPAPEAAAAEGAAA